MGEGGGGVLMAAFYGRGGPLRIWTVQEGEVCDQY